MLVVSVALLLNISSFMENFILSLFCPSQGWFCDLVLGRGGWSCGPALFDNFENKDGKMVHHDAILNVDVELQIIFWKQGRACNLTLFETSCNFRESCENNVSKSYIVKVFETVLNCREKNENKCLFKACILMVVKTIWNCRGK